MNNFKVGDKVERIVDFAGDCPVGTVTTVKVVGENRDLIVSGFHGYYMAKNFKLAHQYPNPPNKHAELIKAWADGADVEFFYFGKWIPLDKAQWLYKFEYRIKPQRSDKDIQKDAQIERLEQQALDLANEIKKLKEH